MTANPLSVIQEILYLSSSATLFNRQGGEAKLHVGAFQLHSVNFSESSNYS